MNELEPFETKNLFDPGVLLEAVDKFENSSSPLTSELLTKSGIDLAFVRKHAQTVIANLNDDFPWPHRLKRLADNYCGDYTDLLSREVMEAAKEKTPHQHRAYVTDPKNNESVSSIVAIARDHLRTKPVFAFFCAMCSTYVALFPRAWLSSHARGYHPTRMAIIPRAWLSSNAHIFGHFVMSCSSTFVHSSHCCTLEEGFGGRKAR